MSQRYAALLIRYRVLVLVAAGAITVLLAAPLVPLENVRFDFSFRRLFRFDGKDAEVLARFKDRFGDDAGALGVLYVCNGANPRRPAALAPDVAASMERVSRWTAGRPEIDSNFSLSPVSATDFYSEPLRVAALRQQSGVLAAGAQDGNAASRAWAAERVPASMEEYEQTAQRIARHELYRGMLLSGDGSAAAAHFRFNMEYLHPSSRRGFLAEFEKVVEEEQTALAGRARLHLFGLPVVTEEYTRLSGRDIATTMPLSMGVMALLLLLFLRSVSGVLLPLIVVAVATVWSIGIMQLTDEPINIINHIVPVMVLVLGVSDAVHLVLRFNEGRARGLSRKEAAREMAAAMTGACFLTNFTNGIGFASLATATIATVASFGVYTGIACMLTYVANISLLPAVLSFAGPPARPIKASLLLDRLLEDLARFLIRNKWKLFISGIVVNVASVAVGAWLIGVDSLLLEEVPPANRVYQATKAVETRLTPVISHDVFIEGRTLAGVTCRSDTDCGREGWLCRREDRVKAALAPYRDAYSKLGVREGLQLIERLDETLRTGQDPTVGTCVGDVRSPKLLKALDAVSARLLGSPDTNVHVRRTDTLAAVVRQMHKAMKKGDPAADTVPDGVEAVSQVLMPLESGAPDMVERYATLDYTSTRLSLSLLDHGSTAWDVVQPALQESLDAQVAADPDLSERFSYVLTGTMTYVEKALAFIISDLLSSVITAFFPIFIIIGLLFRSTRVAILTILPNTLPLGTTLAFMALAGINLRVSTLIIFSVSLGIAVNDTIHFVARYREEIRAGRSQDDAIITTMVHTGRGMMVATTILCAGFLVNLVSEFVALAQFGYLASFTMLAALLGDVFLTAPCILILGEKVPPRDGGQKA